MSCSGGVRGVAVEALFHFLVVVLAVMAGFIAVKYLASYLPDGSYLGALKAVIQGA